MSIRPLDPASIRVAASTMVAKKPKIVIIGAGMAGLTAAANLYTSAKEAFDLCVVEGGSRIGGRINTVELGGVRIEMGATWIHGIRGSPVHQLATKIQALHSDQPWEGMDEASSHLTVAEGGFEMDPSIVESISTLFRNLTRFSEGKPQIEDDDMFREIARMASKTPPSETLSVGSFLRRGLLAYWDSIKDDDGGNWRRRMLEESVFIAQAHTQRIHTSADDLESLDYAAESEYCFFPGEEITIAGGYSSVIESIASVLPPNLIHLSRKVTKIQWQKKGSCSYPVQLVFSDGSTMDADHVMITVSLGVLKAAEKGIVFDPPLPSFKTDAISKLGYGIVNKLFLQKNEESPTFPSLEMVFHKADSDMRCHQIPWWFRKTTSLTPVHRNSSVLLSWFAGKEALEIETLSDEEIIDASSITVSSFLPSRRDNLGSCNGHSNNGEDLQFEFQRVLRSKWGTNPLFLGSYSYIAVGSSGDDIDSIAEALPRGGHNNDGFSFSHSPPLQILFAGEATHRTHYSTTHGAYLSGKREAIRLLKHYDCNGNRDL